MIRCEDIVERRKRDAKIVAHYRKSKSLRQTGTAFKISLERVRQIVMRDEPGAIGPRYLSATAERRAKRHKPWRTRSKKAAARDPSMHEVKP